VAPPTPIPSATGRAGADAGSATVELAAAIPLLVAVAVAMVGILGLARDQVLAQGAAREAAREAAIGGDRTRATAAARAALPPGRAARITVAPAEPDRIRVSVALQVTLPFGVRPVMVSATAVAAREPGPPPAPPTSTVDRSGPRTTSEPSAPPRPTHQ
jgi:Flp pilus assembly protein TadG